MVCGVKKMHKWYVVQVLSSQEKKAKKALEDKKAMEAKDTMKKGNASLTKETKEGLFMSKGILLAGKKTPFIEFNKADYDQAILENRTILLYFYANWCPICRFEEPAAKKAFDELNNPNVVGFRVNYRDSDTDKDEENLAKEFGITYQHTKVIIKNNQKILKNGESWDKQRYIDEVNKYI